MTTASTSTELPTHIGIIMDGNRRWAKAAGFAQASVGHRYGADHLEDMLGWLTARGIRHASVYVLSADNIRKRSGEEVDYLFRLIKEVVPQKVQNTGEWQLHIAGDLGLLPDQSAAALRKAVAATAARRSHLTLAIGYDPKQEMVDAVRAMLAVGERPDDASLETAITEHLSGGPIKDIDLVIRTSGERRISGFFPWQSQRAEIVFCDKLWPAFDERDLDDALAEFARRRASQG
ncbi:polyprenyl diphosphate synthase [Flexivirga caeni]|uniref:Isoprenyl transferase n=1 Tax=Flexivirga caeni TaxID=2294115 RepID=A0A3M9MIW0_9MICO|nr:polyprenyl diphosphate synthase [Flexivirga caeni]RNI25471.1 di-trans,poly-cis-decaprenylcistransferase [Flexivirga caeni]